MNGAAPTGLPVEDVIGQLRAALYGAGGAVLQAEPGAGKTTVVPLRLLHEDWLGDRRILLLEPRRVAARAAAARMAELLGEPVGARVGYTTRDDRRVGPTTRIEVVTDGILTRRLQQDPELAGTALVIFDEFHERHLQADLGLALTLDAKASLRPDLRVLAMSATLDTSALAALLGGVPVVTSAGRLHPVSVEWRPRRSVDRLATDVVSTVSAALVAHPGDVLVFLPGVAEIRQVKAGLGALAGVDVLPLHGSLSPVDQDRVLRGGDGRRVVLATDLAESSVTVEGVGVVVDSGLARRPAYDPASGLTRLITVKVSRASADQRAGRAGRTGPGVVYRLWSRSEHAALRAWPEPEISSVDLAGLALELSVWGVPADALRWLNPPEPGALAAAGRVLEMIGVTSAGRPTEIGRRVADLPLHPRLARMMVEAPGGMRRTAGLVAALMSERDIFVTPGRDQVATADLGARLAVLERRSDDAEWRTDPAAVATVRRRALELGRRLDRGGRRGPANRGGADEIEAGRIDASAIGWLVGLAYPDRLAVSRGNGRYVLRGGTGAALPGHDPLRDAPYLAIADVDGVGRAATDGRIRLAAAIDRADIDAIAGPAVVRRTRLEWDTQVDDLRMVTEVVLDSLVLGSSRSRAVAGPDTADALVRHVVEYGLGGLHWSTAARALQARSSWAARNLAGDWPDTSDTELTRTAADWLTPMLASARGRADLERVDPARALTSVIGSRRGDLDRLAPAAVTLASGRSVPVDYSGDAPRISVRVQDLFGVVGHPTVAGGRTPVVVEILSPAARPIQVTADLPGFWAGTWKDVRREMAVRYPKHHWPDDPAQASAPRRRAPTSAVRRPGAGRRTKGQA